MSPDTTLAVVLLGPPALFGLAVALEWWLEEYRLRRRHASYRARLAAARRRHPSRPATIPVEDRPEWGTR